MTVLPVRSTRIEPLGTCSSPFFPMRVIVLWSITNAEFSTAGLPSPTMSRAPSNTVAVLVAGAVDWVGGGDEHAARKTRDENSPVIDFMQCRPGLQSRHATIELVAHRECNERIVSASACRHDDELLARCRAIRHRVGRHVVRNLAAPHLFAGLR